MASTPCPRLRISIGIGAAYDLAAGAAIALFLRPLSGVLPIPYPQEPLYARLVGVLLMGLGLFYLFAYLDIERHLRNAAGAIAVRVVGGAFLIGYVISPGAPWFFLVFGGLDLAFAAWHLALLKYEARVGFWSLLRTGQDGPGGE